MRDTVISKSPVRMIFGASGADVSRGVERRRDRRRDREMERRRDREMERKRDREMERRRVC